jgi:hypothetical protein
MVRALYLQWPDHDAAYAAPSNFTLGDGLFVATVASPGTDPTVEFWLPPGQWYDFFTGAAVSGDATTTRSVALGEYPVYARAGTILPTQPDLPASNAGPQDELTLNVWAGADGAFELYEDEGTGWGYQAGDYRFTPVTFSEQGSCRELRIGAALGRFFPGALAARSWHIRLVGVDAPQTVRLGDEALPEGGVTPGYSYDASTLTVTVHTGSRATDADQSLFVGDACD